LARNIISICSRNLRLQLLSDNLRFGCPVRPNVWDQSTSKAFRGNEYFTPENWRLEDEMSFWDGKFQGFLMVFALIFANRVKMPACRVTDEPILHFLSCFSAKTLVKPILKKVEKVLFQISNITSTFQENIEGGHFTL